MTFVALWSPDRIDGIPADVVGSLLALSPNVAIASAPGGIMTWVDARGLAARDVARDALDVVRAAGVGETTTGVANVALVAEIAARHGVRRGAVQPTKRRVSHAITRVAPKHEREFLAAHTIAALLETEAWPPTLSGVEVRRAMAALADAGIETCGELAALATDAVEVRFGAAGVALWRLAHGDDPRRIFTRVPRATPGASVRWAEYALHDSARLVFIANRLVSRVCTELRSRGEAARVFTLRFLLADGGVIARRIRSARPSADRAAWLRLVRADFERFHLPDGVCGLAARADTVARLDAPQGDLFDVGFQTATAAEAAVSRLMDDGYGVATRLATSAHILPEQRVRRTVVEFRDVADLLRATARGSAGVRPASSRDSEALALRLLVEPRRVAVTTCTRRNQSVPLSYCERSGNEARNREGGLPTRIVTAAGPDRVLTGHEAGTPVTREYWQCLTDHGRLVLLFRDGGRGVARDGVAREASCDVSVDGGDGGENVSVAAVCPSDPRDTSRADDVWYLHGWWD